MVPEFSGIQVIDQASYILMMEKMKIFYMVKSIKIVFLCYENAIST
tara:strand:- start:3896 stop:4033 length:138 start_codon:yes stop_codon:yes gene_type:complete